MNTNTLTIATRRSPLALWQANWVRAQLEKIYEGIEVTILGLSTQADRLYPTPISEIGGKGLFVKELEEALLDKRADIAVHSMKDVPVELPPGLYLPVCCEREDPLDAFVSNRYEDVNALPPKAIVGTSSLRRQSQLLALRPDLQIIPLRGNVNTRLDRLDEGDFDAIILATAGLKRLSLEFRIRSVIPADQILPAPGQGVIGIECREDDLATMALISPLNHMLTNSCVTAERSLGRALGAGCQVPLAAYAEMQSNYLFLRALVASPDGKTILKAEGMDAFRSAHLLGEAVAKDLIQQGAVALLQQCEK